jgi:ATP-dependent RNA helicase DOB1
VCAALSLQGTLLAQFKQEAKARMSVLQKLNHINAEGTVLLKGRAACEIDTTDELLSTGVCTAGW